MVFTFNWNFNQTISTCIESSVKENINFFLGGRMQARNNLTPTNQITEAWKQVLSEWIFWKATMK